MEKTNLNIDYLVNTLGISIKEAEQLIEEDNMINDGGTCSWEKEVANPYKLKVERVKNEETKRYVNADRVMLINSVKDCLENIGAETEIANAERSVNFTFNNISYTINLIRHN